MAGFDDFLKAIQFGTGLASGFAEAANKSRAESEASTLRLLSILSQDPNYSFQPVQPQDVDRSGGLLAALFGGGRNRVAGTGEPVYQVGGNFLARREAPPIPIPPELFGGTPITTPGTGSAAPPARPFNVPGGTVQPSPPPGGTAPAPGAAPAPRTAPAPQTAKAPAAAGPAPEARAARARQAYARLAPDLRAQIDAVVDEATRLYPNVPRERLLALIGVESGFNPEAVSPAGAIGLTQLMPATARELGVENPRDIRQNILGGAKYLAQQLQAFKDPTHALAAYNAGPGRVQEYGGIPPFRETQAYVPAVQTAENLFAGPGAVAARPPAGTAPEVPSAPGVPPLELPPARTPESFIDEAQRNVYRTLAPQLRNTVAGQQRLGVALNEAVQRGTLRAERELRTARAEAERIKKERQVHSYEVLNALDQVQDTSQLKAVLGYMQQHPEPDHLGDSVKVLARTPDAQLPEMMAKLYPQLLAANYNQEQIKFAWKNFEKRTELPGMVQELRTKAAVEREELPKRAAVEIPLKAQERRALQRVDIEGIPLKQAAELHGILARKEAEESLDLKYAKLKQEATKTYGVELESYAAQMFENKPYRDLPPEQQAAVTERVQQEKLKLAAAGKAEAPIPSELVSRIGAGNTGLQIADDIYRMFQPAFTGPVAGRVGSLKQLVGMTSEQEAQFRQSVSTMAEMIIRSRTGAQASEAELKRSLTTLPDVNDAPNVFLAKLKSATRQLTGQRDDILAGISAVKGTPPPTRQTGLDLAVPAPGAVSAPPAGQAAPLAVTPPSVPRQAPAAVPAIPQGMQPGQSVTLPDGTVIRRKE